MPLAFAFRVSFASYHLATFNIHNHNKMSFTDVLRAATAPGPDQMIPGVVVMAANASGNKSCSYGVGRMTILTYYRQDCVL